MPTLAWIILSGTAMAALALSGSVTLVLPERIFGRVVLPLVALAGGSLLGGALFHLLPEAVTLLGNRAGVYAWLAGGVVCFLVLEQFLQWHHCHRPLAAHRPLGYLILIADGFHNFIDGIAIGTSFIVGTRLGIVTWAVIAAHEIPQELGDFGILVHSGWRRRAALLFNLLSGSTVVLGGLVAYGLAGHVDIAVFLPFAAGSFVYIALADLVPELTTPPTPHERIISTVGFVCGLLLLLLVAVLAG